MDEHLKAFLNQTISLEDFEDQLVAVSQLLAVLKYLEEHFSSLKVVMEEENLVGLLSGTRTLN
jgi:hypothetical protein